MPTSPTIRPDGRTHVVVQVSDTHLSGTHAYFADNFEVFIDEMAILKPDLIVHTGDISFNGPAQPEDLAFAARQMARLPAPVLALAGNHDVGEAPRHSRLKQPLTDARLAAWTGHVGPLWWSRDAGDWRLIGLDTALMASDRPEEAEQLAFLRASLTAHGGKPAMVLMHMPPYYIDPDDPKPTTSAVPHEARRALLDTCRDGGVKVIACGHLHVYRRMRHQGMQVVWAPPTAMVSIEKQWKQWRRWTRPGYIVWRIEGRRISHELVEPRLMIAQDTSRWTEVGGTTTNMPPRPLARFASGETDRCTS
ncbi:MAG: metallophosphoesterase family protein [Beijerinckiaceae bacterium]